MINVNRLIIESILLIVYNYIKELIMSGLTIDIAIWQGLPIGPVSGSTPFGYFDSDAQFQSDAPKISDFCSNQTLSLVKFPMQSDFKRMSGSLQLDKRP
jgi:hypothetical protein